MDRKYKPWLRTLSGIFQNLSLVFFGLAFITPETNEITNFEELLTLTLNVLFGMLFMMLSVEAEHSLEYE